MNGEDGNSLETKVALLMDRETDNHGDVMHKLRNLENGMNFLKDEVIDLQKRIRYVGYGKFKHCRISYSCYCSDGSFNLVGFKD